VAYNYEQVASQATGRRLDDEQLEKFNEKLSHEAELDRFIAGRLNRLGEDVYRQRDDDITSLGAVDCSAPKKPSTEFKNRIFVPSKMRSSRANWIRDVDYYVQNHPRKNYVRMLVVTGGSRIPFGPDFVFQGTIRLKEMSGNVARWISESKKYYGVEVVLKTVETPATDGDGIHVHYHIILITPYMADGRWEQFLRWTRRRLKYHVKDCGRLRNLREAIKYVCKIEGHEGLLELNDDNFMAMYRLLSSQKTISAHHGFKEFRKSLERNKQRVVRRNDQLVLMNKDSRSRHSQDTNITPGGSGPEENVFLGRTLPFPDASGLIQPRLFVKNFEPNPTTGVGRQRLTAIMSMVERAQEWATANGHDCSTYKVHTTTPNIQLPSEDRTVFQDESMRSIDHPRDERHSNAVHPPPPRGVGCQQRRRRSISVVPHRPTVCRLVEINGQMRRISARPGPKPGDRHEDGRVWTDMGGRRGGRWVRPVQLPRMTRAIRRPFEPVLPPSPVHECDVVDPQWLAMRWAGQQDISEVANWMTSGSGGLAGRVGDCPF